VSTAIFWQVPEGVRRTRADKALASAFPAHSRAAFQRAFEAGLVLVGGAPAACDRTIAAGDRVEFRFPEVRESALAPVSIDLDVLFEDAHMIAVNKPAGMVVHPGAGTSEATLVHALLAHCRGSLSGVGGVERPGIVHRLDKETTGVVIAAKTDAAHQALAAQFAARTLEKEYLALAAGTPRLLSGSLRLAIGRNPRQRKRMAVLPEAEGGRAARTDWTLEEAFGGFAARLRCRIHTGRTHQIRVHLRALGHPILGDVSYGWRPSAGYPPPGRVMLHAEKLVLAHPVSGRRMELRAPLPEDFLNVERSLREAVVAQGTAAGKPVRAKKTRHGAR
jgi:23S rRNA pseudouridine1911/1915/1917 synthase